MTSSVLLGPPERAKSHSSDAMKARRQASISESIPEEPPFSGMDAADADYDVPDPFPVPSSSADTDASTHRLNNERGAEKNHLSWGGASSQGAYASSEDRKQNDLRPARADNARTKTPTLKDLSKVRSVSEYQGLELNAMVQATGQRPVYGVIKWMGYLPESNMQEPLVGIEVVSVFAMKNSPQYDPAITSIGLKSSRSHSDTVKPV